MDSEPYSHAHTQRRADSVSQAGAVCPFRVGITMAGRLARKKTAIATQFSLDLLTAKHDNSVHEQIEEPERTGAWHSWRKGAGRQAVRHSDHQNCKQGGDCKSRKTIRR